MLRPRLVIIQFMFLLASAGWLAAQSGRPRPAKKSAPAPLAVPFQAGEKLTYRVMWGVAEAATAQFEILPHRKLRNVDAWHFHVKASTIKAARFLYALDDQFVSFAEPFALHGLQYEMTIREPNKKQDRVIRFNRAGQPALAEGPSVQVPEGTRDPVGLLYSLRAFDWSRKKETTFPVYDGSKVYEVRARETIAQRTVTVPPGQFQASRLELLVFEREKERTDARFWVWLAADPRRTPVLIEAELPFGRLRVELVDAPAN